MSAIGFFVWMAMQAYINASLQVEIDQHAYLVGKLSIICCLNKQLKRIECAAVNLVTIKCSERVGDRC